MTNSMTDFDKLIKETAEKANYEYEPAAWRRFQRQTGFGRSTVKYWVAGVSSALVVGALMTFLIVRDASGSHTDDNLPRVTVCDTSSSPAAENVPLMVEDTLQEVSSPKTTPVSAKTSVVATSQEEVQPKDTKTSVSGSSKPKPVEKIRYGRPLVIDVDTIKENVPSEEELRKGNSRVIEY